MSCCLPLGLTKRDEELKVPVPAKVSAIRAVNVIVAGDTEVFTVFGLKSNANNVGGVVSSAPEARDGTSNRTSNAIPSAYLKAWTIRLTAGCCRAFCWGRARSCFAGALGCG